MPATSSSQNAVWQYSDAERARRDASPWTRVQGVLAPLQFIAFLISLWLIIGYVNDGRGAQAASVSVIIKTLLLYAIMITGSLWEKAVFGRWLFAPAFFWEDMVSMVVIALHSAYLVMLMAGIGDTRLQLQVALAGYFVYIVNALQFLIKFRQARRPQLSVGEAT